MSRYEYAPRTIDDDEFIFDTKTEDRIEYMSELCDLLNQQDEKIKELEKEIKLLKEKLCTKTWKEVEINLDKDLLIAELKENSKKLKKELFDLKNHKLDSIFYGFNDHLEKTIIDKMEIK